LAKLVEPDSQKSNGKRSPRKQAAQRLTDARVRMYRELIFESAECVFGRNGYDGSTMNEIADEAGVSLKTLYATYESKQDLYDRIMRLRAEGFVQRMGAAVSGVEDPIARIERLVAEYVNYLFENEDWLRIHLHARIAWAFRPNDDEVAVSWSTVKDIHGAAIQDGMISGQIYSGDVEEMTIMMQSIMQLQMSMAIDREQKDPEAVVASMLVHIRRLLCPDPA
jgi:AcrR family transcriptional regulator